MARRLREPDVARLGHVGSRAILVDQDLRLPASAHHTRLRPNAGLEDISRIKNFHQIAAVERFGQREKRNCSTAPCIDVCKLHVLLSRVCPFVSPFLLVTDRERVVVLQAVVATYREPVGERLYACDSGVNPSQRTCIFELPRVYRLGTDLRPD